jgi:hypothetical protein
MAAWHEVEAVAPDLAREVRRAFAVRKHATLATLRRDGAPRISGTEVEFTDDGEIVLGSMPGAVKALDLRRDARFALHSPTVDPPEADPSPWPGEAKLAGHAVEVEGLDPGAPAHRFRLDLTEVVWTRVSGDRLLIDSWHPTRGVEHRSRA